MVQMKFTSTQNIMGSCNNKVKWNHVSVGIKTFMSSQWNICCFCCNAVATSTSHFWQESQKRRRNTAPSKIGWPAHGAEFEEIQLECDTINTPQEKNQSAIW